MKKRLVSKKALGYVFGLVSPGGIIYYKSLREFYFTDDTLKHLGISKERYEQIKGKKTFTFEESEKIIQYFGITVDELWMWSSRQLRLPAFLKIHPCYRAGGVRRCPAEYAPSTGEPQITHKFCMVKVVTMGFSARKRAGFFYALNLYYCLYIS